MLRRGLFVWLFWLWGCLFVGMCACLFVFGRRLVLLCSPVAQSCPFTAYLPKSSTLITFVQRDEKKKLETKSQDGD